MPLEAGLERAQQLAAHRRVLCLVTDRQRLTTAVGARSDAWEPFLLAQIEGAVEGGVDVVQIREPDLEAQALLRLAQRCLQLTAGTRTRVVINSRLDVAVAAGAHGVHLRSDDPPTASMRSLVPSAMLLGRSVHSQGDFNTVGPVDYVIAGSVFETVSKPGAAALGLAGLRALIRRAGDCWVWAIGGITAENLEGVARAGARGVAAIGAFIPRANGASATVHPLSLTAIAADVKKMTRDLRFSFDSVAGLP